MRVVKVGLSSVELRTSTVTPYNLERVWRMTQACDGDGARLYSCRCQEWYAVTSRRWPYASRRGPRARCDAPVARVPQR